VDEAPEIVIVGGGIAGGALATVLARAGLSVVVLERELAHIDQVRGEFLALWGVAEASQLGLLDTLIAAGGFHTPRAVSYDENAPLDQAEALARDLSTFLPGVPGPLCCGHPAMCAALAASSEAAGARILGGAKNVAVVSGLPPQISFSWNGRGFDWRPRLIVGADGRSSNVRRQLSFGWNTDPPHNFLGGMLVAGVPQWPLDTFSIGTQGDLQYFVFPQGAGKLRLYTCWALDAPKRFAGPERGRRVLEAFEKLSCLRHSDSIACSTPIGPFNAFPNEDRWTDDPTLPGVLLIGDAAGYNDPIAGQGLAIALRDVRVVRDLLVGSDFTQATLKPFLKERAERMRRLRIVGRLMATLRAEFGPGAPARRARALQRSFRDGWPSPLLASTVGPERLPAEVFEEASIDRLLN
jgi:2-polyprenyl-6-methoxyphenol hydroxylase-like FAD-dependent oxidoreductase